MITAIIAMITITMMIPIITMIMLITIREAWGVPPPHRKISQKRWLWGEKCRFWGFWATAVRIHESAKKGRGGVEKCHRVFPGFPNNDGDDDNDNEDGVRR